MKRALVTGGSGTIGSAISLQLARDGLHVIVHANTNIEQAQQIVAQIQASGGSAESVCFDITQPDKTKHILMQLLEIDEIQVLINNAGIHYDAPLAGMEQDQWQQVIDVNLNGFFTVTQLLLLPMIATRWGRIISISSIAAIAGNRGQANYAAAKSGLHGASKSLAIELASRGITVNVVAPGIIESPMSEQYFSSELIKKLIPMQRAGTPQEVADLVSFLASERASYISGQIISINGAMI